VSQPQESRDLACVHIDRGLLRLCEVIVRRGIEPAIGNVPIWNHGLGDLVEEFIGECGVPRGPITVVDLARRAGILKKGAPR
jgi:hypothetical protein